MKCPVCGMEAENAEKHDREMHPGELAKWKQQHPGQM